MSLHRPLHDAWTVRPIGGPSDDLSDDPSGGLSGGLSGGRSGGASPDGRPTLGPVPATVPGSVHTDLLAAGLIPDPYLGDNETRLTWIGRTAWRYETAFTWAGTGHERVDLVCEGLDTVAGVRLNGTVLGETANMHRSHRFDVRPALREGENRLVVDFAPALVYAERLCAELGYRPAAYPTPFNFIRKMACNFGWDWGPALVTAGIWRPIGLHEWSGARIAAVRPLVTLTEGGARVEVHVEVERAGTDAEPALLPITATVAGATGQAALAPGATSAVVTLDVAAPELWWPRGYGGQPRYELEVTLGSGTSCDTWRRRIGFREVRLDTEDGAFTLVINGTPIFARGANWIPDDCFPHRVGRERYAQRLAQACEAGLNLLRVWGGGIYESEDFYDLCDELGLMVWQDFLFACAAYPEEEPLAGEVAAEAREAVTRLSPHPSLVLWCGNNENIWGHADWSWELFLEGRSWGAGYYLSTLPRIVAELDPTRPYWPGSPYSGSMEVHPNVPEVGTMHIWDVWNERDYAAYREYRPRFVAEFGFQGPAAHATLRRAVGEEALTPDSPLLAHHQKAIDGDLKLAAGLKPYFPVPEDFDDWHYLTQLNQARAIMLGVEHFRSLWPYCAGSVVWQLNDCWPVVSWAAVDGDGRRKPMFHALRRAYADRLLTLQPRPGGLALVAVNDTSEPWYVRGDAARHDMDGEVLAAAGVEITVPPRGAETVVLPPAVRDPGDVHRELVAVTAGGTRALWFFAPDKDLALSAPRFDAAVARVAGGVRVRITAHSLLRDLALFPDRLDPAAEIDDQLVTLLPGESATFLIGGVRRLEETALLTAPVLRCVNQIVAGGGHDRPHD
jgi:beta-mannosidase